MNRESDEFPTDRDVREYLLSREYLEKVSEIVQCSERRPREREEWQEDVVGAIVENIVFKLQENPVKDGEMQLADRRFNIKIGGRHFDKVILVADKRWKRPRPQEGVVYPLCEITRTLRGGREIAVFAVMTLIKP